MTLLPPARTTDLWCGEPPTGFTKKPGHATAKPHLPSFLAVYPPEISDFALGISGSNQTYPWSGILQWGGVGPGSAHPATPPPSSLAFKVKKEKKTCPRPPNDPNEPRQPWAAGEGGKSRAEGPRAVGAARRTGTKAEARRDMAGRGHPLAGHSHPEGHVLHESIRQFRDVPTVSSGLWPGGVRRVFSFSRNPLKKMLRMPSPSSLQFIIPFRLPFLPPHVSLQPGPIILAGVGWRRLRRSRRRRRLGTAATGESTWGGMEEKGGGQWVGGKL